LCVFQLECTGKQENKERAITHKNIYTLSNTYSYTKQIYDYKKYLSQTQTLTATKIADKVLQVADCTSFTIRNAVEYCMHYYNL